LNPIWAGHGLLVGAFAGVDPVGVDINGFRQVVDGRLVVLQTDPAPDPAGVPGPVQLDLAGLLVVAEGTIEQLVQLLDGLPPGRRFPLRLALPHYTTDTISSAEETGLGGAISCLTNCPIGSTYTLF